MSTILRYVIILVVIVTFINAIIFFGMGIYFSIETYVHLIGKIEDTRPGIRMLESIDRFFIGFIFIIFSMGLANLYLPNTKFFKTFDLPWLRIENFFQLKMVLWSTILTALFVSWVVVIMDKELGVVWQDLLVPGTILILGIAAGFVKKIHQD